MSIGFQILGDDGDHSIELVRPRCTAVGFPLPDGGYPEPLRNKHLALDESNRASVFPLVEYLPIA